jgi:hypothetical protein
MDSGRAPGHRRCRHRLWGRPGPRHRPDRRRAGQVKADRDQLAALVRQLSTTSATLEAYTINDRKGCLDQLKTVRKRIIAARTDLATRNAARHLDSASKGLDDALGGDCAPATP